MNPFNHPYPGTPGQPQQFASYPGYPQSFPVYPQQFIPTYPAVPTPYPAYPSQQFLPQPPQLHQHPTLQLGTWPPFPLTYRDLFGFSMPEPAADRTNTTTTAPWSGSDPPQYPLCYSYRDQTIIPRALQGLHSYIERKQWWNKPTPAEAAMLWANLEVQYQTGEYEKELWLAPVMTILQMIVKALMHDLELAYSVSEVIPRLQHRQVGDIDWAVFTQHTPARTLTSVLLDQLHLPPRIPIVGPGSAIEQKVTGVLENYRTFFSQPFQLFLPPGPHVQGHAIVFKLDMQMCHRIMNDVSCPPPRFGLVYSGHQCIVLENMSPTMPKAPFQIGAHDRAPPTTAPLPGMDPRIRGVGQSDLQPLVPSAQPTPSALPRCPFVALLVAINAPRGALAFEPPDRLLTKDAYAQYVAAFPPMPPAPSSAGPSSSSQVPRQGRPRAKNNSGSNPRCRGAAAGPENIVSFDPPRGSARSLPSTDPEQLTIKFGLPLSQDPQLLRKLSRSHINEAKSGRFSPSLPLDGPSSFLSLDSVIPSGEQASVHRGTLDGDRPVIAKLYDACNFDALLREVDAYECMTLSSAVPKCLGVFGPSHRAWAALILEDKGEPLVARWQDLSLEDRIAVYKAAAEVHAAGVLHGDLERRNFIRHQDGGLYAIDFGHSTVGHLCMPETCSELHGLRQHLGLDGLFGRNYQGGVSTCVA